MKILIEGATIITFRSDKPIIDKGFIYINKGVIAAIGEGSPPPEYEFAEYIIDGRGRVVLPGFVVGIGSLEKMLVAYVSKCSEHVNECLQVLSKDELKSLIESTLTLLSFRGATSVVLYVDSEDIVSIASKAISEAWIRTRLVFRDPENLREGVKLATRSVVDQEVIPRGIISFGVISKKRSPLKLEELQSLDAYAYVDKCENAPEPSESDRVICVNSSVNAKRKVVIDVLEMWRGNEAVGFTDPTLMNPSRMLQVLRFQGISSEDAIKVIAHLNPQGFGIGTDKIAEGAIADLIIVNLREPPYGPLPFDVKGLYELMSYGLFGVETAIIAGELVIDRFEPLMIGRKVFDVVMKIREELTSRR